MSVLWMGGEDIDFPAGNSLNIDTTTGHFRSGYARCGIYCQSTTVRSKSTAFPAGAITSAWLTFRPYFYTGQSGYTSIGLSKSATNNSIYARIYATQVAICKWDGTTETILANTSIPDQTGTIPKYDVQISNYGATGTVNIYATGVLLLTYTGYLVAGGETSLNTVIIGQTGNIGPISEIVVQDTTTQTITGLVTLAPTGFGTTHAWTGAYGNLSGVTISDSTPIISNTAGQDEQFTLTGLPTTDYAIAAVKVIARIAQSSDSVPTHIKLGYNLAGTVTVGSAITPTTSYSPYERYDATNPVSAVSWVTGDIPTMQIDIQSAT